MESPAMIRRYAGRMFRAGYGCGRSINRNQSNLLSTPSSRSTRSTYGRFFSSTSISRADGQEAGKPRAGSPFTRAPKNQEATGQNQRSQDRPRRPSRDGGRIDLSTIPGMPSSYRPPTRPDEATAQAKLRSLLGAVASPSSSSSSQPKKSQPGSANDSDNAISSLDAYRDRRPTPTFDLASLIEDLDKPRRGNKNNNYNQGYPSDIDQPVEVLRLRPTLGRTVNVTPATGFDLTRAFRQLEIKCNANSVKRDEIKQRFHVRRGQQRKLDRRTRWRILFKEGFIAECARIRRMRAQGW